MPMSIESAPMHTFPPVDLQQMGIMALNVWIVALACFGLGLALVSLKFVVTSSKTTFSLINLCPSWLLRAIMGALDEHEASNRAVREESQKQSVPDVDLQSLPPPNHVAAIMDGNRRWGKEKYGNAIKGHWEGGEQLRRFYDWCIKHGVKILTVYAFSTENWNRSKQEVDALMEIFQVKISTIRDDAVAKGICVRLVASDADRLPAKVLELLLDLEQFTAHHTNFYLNICVSYGSRGEIVNAAKELAKSAAQGDIDPEMIDEQMLNQALSTRGMPDPDVLIRTSEMRLSNFLLWQLAYSELVFLPKLWPEVTEDDLVDVINTYKRRKRRFGK